MSELRDKILQFDDIEVETVTVPEWGGVTVELRTPTVQARGELISQFMKDTGKIDYVRMYPALVVATSYDPETGEQLFTNDDVDALTLKSSKAMERLGEVAIKLSGLENAAERIDAGKDASTPILNSLTDSG